MSGLGTNRAANQAYRRSLLVPQRPTKALRNRSSNGSGAELT